MAIVLIATLDTKGPEMGFVRDRLKQAGLETLLLDVGTGGQAKIAADVSTDALLHHVESSLESLTQSGDRGQAVEGITHAVTQYVIDWHQQKPVQAVLALGGSAGTTIGTSVMRALPFGIPKIMVSTLASGQVRPFVGPRDILMFHSVTDISGLNRLTRSILARAADALAGMVQGRSLSTDDFSNESRPLITASMFGVTTPCVEKCQQLLESRDYETVVFHAVGTGGQAMESLIIDGLIAGSLDLTTTELADELVGGVLSAGPDRLTAMTQAAIPAVVSVGALDMVNFGPRDTVPDHFSDRLFHIHNANVTLMRTTPDENAQLGHLLADRVLANPAPTLLLWPNLGLSALDAQGQPFWNPQADAALKDALEKKLRPADRWETIDCHINHPAFAERVVARLIEMIREGRPNQS